MSPEDIDLLVLKLRSESPRQIELAERQLEELTASDIAALIDRSNSRDRSNETITGCGFILTALLLPFGLLFGLRELRSTGFEVEEVALERVQDRLTVGPILLYLEGAKQPMKGHMVRALRRLLPKLTAEDSTSLNEREKEVLNRMISTNASKYDSGILIAAIEALTSVGNAASLEAVRTLANRAPREAKEHLVAEAAKTCEPLLVKRLEEKRHADVLLRAASSGNDDTLVRPAESILDLESSRLLRSNE